MEATPRVNASLRQSFTGQTVRMIAKVVQVRGESALVDASGQVEVHLNKMSNLQEGHAVELIGKIMPDLSLTILTSIDFGTTIDFPTVDALVNISHQHKDLFY